MALIEKESRDGRSSPPGAPGRTGREGRGFFKKREKMFDKGSGMMFT
jgi:hypothetical protein